MVTKFCPQCGSSVGKEDRFCPTCGASLAEDSAPRRPAAPRARSTKTSPLLSPLVLGAIALAGVLMIAAGLLLREDTPGVATAPTTVAVQPTLAATQATVAGAPVTEATAPPSIPFPNIPRIALAEAQTRLEDPDVVFVDVRDVEDYDVAHIPGALSIPLAANELSAAYEELAQDREIIIYCTWPSEELSARAAQLLLDEGYSNVNALEGRFGAWLDAGFPTE